MELSEAFEILVNKIINREKFYSLYGKVKSVDETKRTCVVTPIGDEADVEGVRLQGSIGSKVGFLLIPSVNSVVSVTFVNDTNAFISLCTKIDKILIDTDLVQFNGGDLGGLIKIEKLKTELAKNNAIIDAFKQVLNTPVTEPGNGAPSALQIALLAALGTLTTGDFNLMEDTKITH